MREQARTCTPVRKVQPQGSPPSADAVRWPAGSTVAASLASSFVGPAKALSACTHFHSVWNGERVERLEARWMPATRP